MLMEKFQKYQIIKSIRNSGSFKNTLLIDFKSDFLSIKFIQLILAPFSDYQIQIINLNTENCEKIANKRNG